MKAEKSITHAAHQPKLRHEKMPNPDINMALNINAMITV